MTSCIITCIRYQDRSSSEDCSPSQISQIQNSKHASFVKGLIYKFFEPKPISGQTKEALAKKAQDQWFMHAVRYILNESALPYYSFRWTSTREEGSSSILVTGTKALIVEIDQLFTDPQPVKNTNQKIAVVFRTSLGKKTVYSIKEIEALSHEDPTNRLLVIFWNSSLTQLCLDPDTSTQEISALTYTKLTLDDKPLNPKDRIPGANEIDASHANGQSSPESTPNVANTIMKLPLRPPNNANQPPLPPKKATGQTSESLEVKTPSNQIRQNVAPSASVQRSKPSASTPSKSAPSNSKPLPSYMRPTRSSAKNAKPSSKSD